MGDPAGKTGHLGLGQWIGAPGLHRVLGGNDKKENITTNPGMDKGKIMESRLTALEKAISSHLSLPDKDSKNREK